tara:strand:- start:580 stop:1068 length:489 start_codon:yes stop_codon:yes gene_type:complete
MAKQLYTIRSFAQGMNTRRDPRDIAEDEASFIKNMSIDSIGKIKTAGSIVSHSESNYGEGSGAEAVISSNKYISTINVAIDGLSSGQTLLTYAQGGGGYNLFYFESDHSNSADELLTFQTSDGTDTNGEITFTKTSTYGSSGFSLTAPSGDSPQDQGGGSLN